MREFKYLLILVLALASQGVGAHGHVILDMSVGQYPGSFYTPVPVLVVQPPQIQYVEQQMPEAQTEQQAAHYWYHCGKPQGYYPYVTQCPGGWTKVSPQPQGQ